MSLSRKVLNVTAIIEFISGGFELLLCALIAAAGIIAMHNPEFAAEIPAELPVEMVLIVAAVFGIAAIASFVWGILQRRAVKNPAKIMPVWVISLISLIGNVIGIVYNIANHAALADMKSGFIGLAISLLLFIVANNVKKEAGK